MPSDLLDTALAIRDAIQFLSPDQQVRFDKTYGLVQSLMGFEECAAAVALVVSEMAEKVQREEP